jgi:hypothetical protein
MSLTAQRNVLRLSVALAGIVPVAGGLWGVVGGIGGAGAWSGNHYRYLSGLLLAIGLGFWSVVPHIERHTQRVRLLAALVVVGGLCRLLGVTLGDPLTPGVAGALAMELLVTPLLCFWQGQVSITK